MVFYRKYRPQKISELDLTSVRERLSAILISKNLPHAFLFTGPKGLGKTSSARILAKAISCLKKEGIEPCNKCEVCTSITNGSNIDVLEIDAASNRGVDEIRDLREKIKFSPVLLKKKIYIIDEVHMLTTEAFNALLKTLEEPPDHAVFVLCTTESWKLPSTIVSRAFVVNFDKATPAELARSLKRILDGENLSLDEYVSQQIYKISEGSFRDGAKAIEELSLSAQDKKITKEIFEKAYKTQSMDNQIKDLVLLLLKKDAKNALITVDLMAKGGADFKIATEKIVDYLRTMLLTKLEILDGAKIEAKVSDLKRLVELFNEAYKGIKFSVLPQLPIELAVVKWSLFEEEEKVADKVQDEAPVAAVKASPAMPFALKKPQEEVKGPMVVHQKTLEDTNDKGFRELLIDKIKKDNNSVAGLLRSCRVMVKDKKIEIVAPYKFHGEKLREAKVQELLHAKLVEIAGSSVTFTVAIQEDK